MPFFHSRLPLLPLTFVLALGACQSTGEGGGTLETKPLPPNTRALIARQLAVDYLSDGVGPATISETRPGLGLLGTGKQALDVRYPVKARGMFAAAGATTKRCISVTVSQEGEGKIAIGTSRGRHDDDYCAGADPLEVFTELTRLGERAMACKAKGEAPCLLSHNGMSEAEARRLMRAR